MSKINTNIFSAAQKIKSISIPPSRIEEKLVTSYPGSSFGLGEKSWVYNDFDLGRQFHSVTTNGEIFCAIGTNSTGPFIASSTNGLNWTLRYTTSFSYAECFITWENNLFLACAGRHILTSPDGITWTLQTSDLIRAVNSITYGNNLFVGVGADAYIVTSPDAAIWTLRTPPKHYTLITVAYGNGVFVAGGQQKDFGLNSYLLTSADGITWTERAINSWSSIRDIVWDGNKFYAVTAPSYITSDMHVGIQYYTIYTSDDGITWSYFRTVPGGRTLHGVGGYDGNICVVGTDGFAFADILVDGVWVAVSGGVKRGQFLDVVYDRVNDLFCSVGYDGAYGSYSAILVSQSKAINKVGVSSIGVISAPGTGADAGPAAQVNTDATLSFNWYNKDIDGLSVVSYGNFTRHITTDIDTEDNGILVISSYGTLNTGKKFSVDAVTKLSVVSAGDIRTDVLKNNWVKWSNIGSLDFTIGRDNVAGERPLDWSGMIYCVKKLNGKIVVYGENGVSFLIPSGVAFGLKTIYRIGLKGKCAIAGNESKHFFIDNSGKLCEVSDTFRVHDFSEYLSKLTSNLVMSYDELENFIYICDGSLGYVFNTVTSNLGGCSSNITGIGYKTGIQYVAASNTISVDPFEICTGIYDLGERANKTIFSLELGVSLENALYVAIDYRRIKSSNFVQTPWKLVPPNGRVNIIAWGVEFRFRVKVLEYEYFELNYIRVNGVLNAY
ncbi:MAG: hypothetical protein ACTSQA_00455 [Candidatus Heimdallarchaeaceae archaeon]